MMVNITVGSFKGGVGKSTISLNFAYELSRKYKVLLVDTDPQNSLGFFLCQDFKKGFSEVLFEEGKPEDFIKKPFNDTRLYFLPAGSLCIGNPIFYEDNFTVDRVENFLDRIRFLEFDYVIYDTPPRISNHIESLVKVSDDLIIVLNPDPATYSSFIIFLKFLEKNHLENKTYYIVNKAEPTKISEDFIKLISANFNEKNLGIIPRDFKVMESQGKCKPATMYDPNTPFSISLKKTVEAYLKLKNVVY
ncbi:MAG: hypothetical protein C0198_02710 [Sulfurihydrogenibium sp.]|nr:MAG: hypothetical protein C0198_02710 [Sulfurihydrogenibium sp.]